MVQVIWSYTGYVLLLCVPITQSCLPVVSSTLIKDSIMFVPATSQMTFKYYNPTTKQATWKSVNVGSWKPDGRGCKSDHFVRPIAAVF